MSNDFSLSNILEIKQSKETKESDIIKYHYNQAKLRICDSYNNYLDSCYYRIPEFISKLPNYDSNKTAKKLVKYMKRKGFKCKVAYESNIFFEWKPKERPQDHIPFILRNLQNRIKYEAKNNNDYLFYEIPSILPEFPWYNTHETARIIGQKISDKGFIVKIHDQVLFICWNKKELEKKSKIKINFQTNEEKEEENQNKLELINENRYKFFMNPKRNKNSNIDFDDTEEIQQETNSFDVSRVLHLY